MNATMSSRVLGKRLRAMRALAGLTGRHVASIMEYSEAKLSRQEHGTHSISVHELSHLVTHIYNRVVSPDGTVEQKSHEELSRELDDLEALRQRAARGRGWWTEYEGDLPLHLKSYLELETEAELVRTLGIEVIPGLLQTPAYIRMQAAVAGETDEDAISRSVWLRSQRQRLLESNLGLDAIVAEGALRRCVTSGLYDQIETLLERSELPGVTVRILPDATGIHSITGSYAILSLPNGLLDPVMYLEFPGGSIMVEEKRAVDRAIETHISLPAMDPDDSRSFLKDFLARRKSGIGAA